MKKIAVFTAKVCIVLAGMMAVAMTGYGLYQQSTLYPAIHQTLGYQQCVAEVNAQLAQQQALQSNSTQENEK